MQIVNHSVLSPNASLCEIPLVAARQEVVKRRWRGVADDGMEFGFDLKKPLRHGMTFWQSATARYVLHQQPEAVVEIALDLPPSAVAGLGWAIGNLHLELASESTRLLAPDETAVRALLDRLDVPYRTTSAVFQPGRFARHQQAPHELGPSHRH
ncbi:MAG TPA: urease accessory protein UreE [Candidatus Didemnitutus sp.]|nr:urease accessory protein UreE [Candidatus Didemnitutus sp.]